MNKYIELIKNIGILTLGSFATKFLSFFLVPLYTNILTTSEYGIYDMFNTTIAVLLPILTLNIQESVIRFAMDKKYNKDALITIAAKYFIIGNCLVIGALLINYIFSFSEIFREYAFFFFLMYFIQTFSGIVVGYTRGIDKIAQLSISGVIASIAVLCCNICFLFFFKWGLVGYFLANIIGPLLQVVYLFFLTGMQKHIRKRNCYKKEEKELLKYCKPMIANSLAWWVNNASDRYMIIFFSGFSVNGIYSVASKIPSILNLVQGIFNQVWTLSAVQNYDSEDKDCFFSNMYSAYNGVMVLICSVIIVLDKPLAKILYAKDFYIAWMYVPWLAIAVVFGAMSGYIGGVFSAVKDSKIFAHTTLVGAVANVLINFIFIPTLGAMGAAVATMVAYIIVWYVRYIYAKKYIKIRIKIKRDLVSYCILIIQALILLIIRENKELFLVQAALFSIIVFIYVRDIVPVLGKGRGSRL